jgi:uncharacterized membrane protein
VRTLDLDRFLTFIDAIVAIAVTLLVLPLVDLLSDADEKVRFSELMSSDVAVARISTFLLSFAVIFRLWRVHHKLLEPIESYDRFVVVATMAWALTIVVLPFPTALIAVYDNDRGAMGLYLGVLTLSSASLSALSVYLVRRPELHKEETDASVTMAVPSVVSTVLLLLATVVAELVPRIGYGALLLLLLTGVATNLWNRRFGSASKHPEPTVN